MNELLDLVLNPLINVFDTVATLAAFAGWPTIIACGVLLFGALTLIEVAFDLGAQAFHALFRRRRT